MASNGSVAVVERLVGDDYVHEQLTAAVDGLRDAYRRARRLPPHEVVQDKRVYDRVRQAATGLTEAARRAAGEPEPKPRRRGRRALLLLVLGATGAVVYAAARNDRRMRTQVTPAAADRAVPASAVLGDA